MDNAIFTKSGVSALSGNMFSRIGDGWMLISVSSPDGRAPNAMTASWGCMGILWNKPVCIGFIRPQRFTFPMACAADRMSFAFLDEQYRSALRYCGTHSGHEGDKFPAAGLTPVYTDDVRHVPFPAEASTVIIGRKLYEDDLKENCFLDASLLSHYLQKDYHRFFICEIEDVLVRQS